ncbi:SDR family oxidoreductase [Salinibacterium sp.]|uniref:SDR family NAD(P)-dependent oxidoreductase n=1 Tax=Salinibacterium sp. TaxID=1915057 RepID=UPI00286C0794|nr:SDR family oxidoreductase [Salinibacterium sp.]
MTILQARDSTMTPAVTKSAIDTVEVASIEQGFVGKVAIVTGADTPLGASIAHLLAAHGARIALVGRDEMFLRILESTIAATGGDAVVLVADVRDRITMQGVVMATVERFGALHLAVNSGAAIPETSRRRGAGGKHEDVITVDQSALFYAMRVQLPAIEAAGGGAVVNIASVYGQWGFPERATSIDGAGGVSSLTRSAARQWGRRGVRINELQPGVINSWPRGEKPEAKAAGAIVSSIPANRIGEPSEVAAAVLFLLSDSASYITGARLAVDGGYAA